MALDELVAAIRAAEVESPSGFDEAPLLVEGGNAFDLPPRDVVVRPQQALAALQSNDASIQAYTYSDATVFQGCRLIAEARSPYVIFVFGRVEGNRRLIGGAFRLYADDTDELSRLAADPSLAFAVALDRFGLDYRVGAAERARFVPVLLIPRDKVDLSAPMTVEKIFPGLHSALDLAVPAEESVVSINLKIPSTGPVQLLWPFAINIAAYVRDVRSRRRH